MEQWKIVKGWERYEVSDHGKVRNKITGRTLRAQDKRGYLCVELYSNGKTIQTGIHRLVAAAFLKQDPNRSYVNHIDGNKKNNFVTNLEWVTQSENRLHATRVLHQSGGMTGKHHSLEAKEKMRQAHCGIQKSEETKAKIRESTKRRGDSHRSKKVRNIETGEVFDCIFNAGEKYGNRRNISLCCNGKRKTSNGYHWEYVKDTE